MCIIQTLPFNLFQLIMGLGFPVAEHGSKTLSPERTSWSEGLISHSGGTKEK